MSDTPRVGIEVAVDGSGAEAGLARVDAAVTRTGRTLDTLGERGSSALDSVGTQGGAAAGRVDAATRNMAASIQRATVAMSAGAKGTAEYYAALANSRGLNVAALKPYLDQLDAVTKKTAAAAEAQRQMETNTRFLDGLRSQAEGIGKTASQLAALRAEQLGVADAARPFIEQLREAEEAAGGATESFGGMAQAISAIAFGGSVAAIVQLSDEYGKYVAQLRLATEGQTEFQNAQNAVRRIATTSQADLSATASLYANITKGTRELGLAQSQVANITETVSLALKVSGASGAEASSAILQLSQAFASGTLRGDEFNSVNEAAPRLMQALADGMGVPIGALRKMAEEGKLTTAVLADSLPRALGTLREEAKSVESIAGAYAVLKNNVLEMVGATAQSNGVVAALSGSINLLAENLTLAAGAMGTIVAVKLGTSLAAVAREAYAAAAANQARLTSNLAAARADVAATASASALAAARVAELRSSVLAADGAVALAITTNGLIPAQTRAAAASAAHTAALSAQTAAMGAASVAGRAASGALALLGGPVGAVIGLLGVAATAWAVWGETAEESGKDVSETTEATTEEVIASLDKQIAKLKERNRLAEIGFKPAEIQAPGAEKLAEVVAQIDRVAKAEGDYANLSLAARTEILKVLGGQYGVLTEKIAAFNRESEVDANNRNKKSAGEWMLKYATNAEKLKAELKKAREELGAAFTPELEARIKKQFEERKIGADKEASAYANLKTAIDERIVQTAREAAGLKPLTDSQKLQVELEASLASGKLKLTAAQKTEYEEKIRGLAANESVIESQKRAAQGQAEIEKLYKSLATEQARAVQQAVDEANRNEELVRTFGMTKTAIAEVELARLEEQLAQRSSLGLTLDEIEHLEKLIDAKKRSVAAMETLETREAAVKAAKEAEEAWKRTAATIEESLTDALMRGFEDGKSFADNFRDTLVNMFKTMVLRPTIQAALQPMTNSLTGALQAGGSGGTFGSATDLISIGKTIYSGFTGGMAASMGSYITQFGNLFGSQAISAFGTGMGLTTAQAGAAATAYGGTGTAVGGGLTSGASAASAVPVIGWIIAGMMANNKFFKEGWDIDGQTGSIAKSLFGASGDALKRGDLFGSSLMNTGALATIGINAANNVLGKIGLNDQMASLLSGSSLWTRAFGHQKATIESQGIEGNLSSSGFSGEAFANVLQKGGWFRSDKRSTMTAALDAERDGAFDTTMAGMVAAVKGFGSALGVETSAIDGYNKAIKLTLTSDEAKNQEAIAALFTGVADDLATILVPSISKFSAEGETASTTLQRVATNFSSVTSIMQAIGVDAGVAFGAVGIASIEARERLIDLAGGVDTLASQTSFFAQNFLSEAEQLAPLQKSVAEQMSALGYAGVTTSEQFKAAVLGLANGGKLATAEGAKTYEALLALAPAFKTVSDAAVEAATRRASLEGQIYDLTHTQAEATARQRQAELAAMSASDRVLQERIYTLQDEKDAAEALASVNKGYQDQIDGILKGRMTDAELRAVETQGMSESTIALYDRLKALQDEDEAMAAAKASAESLSDSLAEIMGTAEQSVQDVLRSMMATLSEIQGARSSAQDAIRDARLAGMSPADRLAALRKEEESLFGKLGTTDDPAGVAAQLQAVILDRIKEEVGLSEKLNTTAIDTLKTQISGYEELQSMAKQFAQFTAELRFGDLSALNNTDQLGTAAALYQRTLQDALAGDTDAMSNLTGNAQAYLEEARSYYASSGDYASIFDSVVNALDSLGATDYDPQIQAWKDQLTALEDVDASVVLSSELTIEAMTRLDDGLREREVKAQAAVDKQLQLAQSQIDNQQKIIDRLEAQMGQHAAIATQNAEKLDAANALLQAIADSERLKEAQTA